MARSAPPKLATTILPSGCIASAWCRPAHVVDRALPRVAEAHVGRAVGLQPDDRHVPAPSPGDDDLAVGLERDRLAELKLRKSMSGCAEGWVVRAVGFRRADA